MEKWKMDFENGNVCMHVYRESMLKWFWYKLFTNECICIFWNVFIMCMGFSTLSGGSYNSPNFSRDAGVVRTPPSLFVWSISSRWVLRSGQSWHSLPSYIIDFCILYCIFVCWTELLRFNWVVICLCGPCLI